MAPPDKQSDFMVFVKHWRWKYPALSVPEAVSQCGVIWEKMSAQERKPFVGGSKKPQPAISEADKVQLKVNEREEHLKRTTERIVLEGKKFQDLENMKFLFCAFNYFTKDPDGDVYVPAEFSACEYSLKKGIKSVFSTLIDPGQLNLGLSRAALDHSTSTHMLPLPPKALGESNLAKLQTQISRYLNKCPGRGPAIVYTSTEMRPIVQSCFRFLAGNKKDDFLLELQVFDIQYLFYVLKREILDMVGLPNDRINVHFTDAFFLKDFFEFTIDIGCDFHEENDRTKYCTESLVTRWAFTFSDFMCGDLGIYVVPGKHVPANAKPKYRIHNADTLSETLDCGSSVETFHSLPSLQGLQINEAVSKSHRLRTDISTISSRCSSASAFEEVEEYDRQGGGRPNEFSDAFVTFSSRCSSTCGPQADVDQKGSSKARKDPRQGGYHRNPTVDKQRRSPEEFPDEISSINSRRSSASMPYGAKDQKDSLKAEKYHLYPSVKIHRGSSEELLDENSPISSSRSSASMPYGAKDLNGSSKAEKYRRNPSVRLQHRCLGELLMEMSQESYSSRDENSLRQVERQRQDRKYSVEREKTVYSRPFVNKPADETLEFDD